MAQRLATAAVGIPILLFFIWIGGIPFIGLVAAITAFAAFELARMASGWGDRASVVVSIAAATALIVSGVFYEPASSLGRILGFVTTAYALVSAAYLLFAVPADLFRNRIISTLAVVGYVGATMTHGPMIRGLEDGMAWIIVLLIVTFSTDTGALIFGNLFGRRKLAPSISPGKTWEGAIGGLVIGIVACVVATSLFSLDVSIASAVALGTALGVTGQLGDLAESRLKRQADTKDSSSLVPGHGGVLDRLDSVVWTLVVVYHFVS
ncbi:MAG: phosphatidate cytidylyltransferase [SAR202 cluster bacterium]|nr:phosphatidate cytidylyltransferase [SAR202 cluster bacterium]